jgi:hypothetical protein
LCAIGANDCSRCKRALHRPKRYTRRDRIAANSTEIRNLDAMSEAIKTVRPALADFYASLSDEQKGRFNTLGPPNTSRQG